MGFPERSYHLELEVTLLRAMRGAGRDGRRVGRVGHAGRGQGWPVGVTFTWPSRDLTDPHLPPALPPPNTLTQQRPLAAWRPAGSGR